MSTSSAISVFFADTICSQVEIFKGEYDGYIWPCVAVWSSDRLARVVRLVVLNIPYRKSIVSYDSDADVIRLDVPKPKLLRPRPGTYYYIYVLHGLKCWESHPFTLSSWSEGYAGDIGSDGKEEIPKSKMYLSFLIRPHDSFTSRLRKLMLQRQSTNTSKASGAALRVLLEGPYGHHINLKQYDSLLFVVGGTGITVALSHLCDLSQVWGHTRPTIRLV
jgi:predicted ferric reductase